MPFDKVVEKLELERYWKPEEMGIGDADFFKKLLLLGAISNLRYSILETSPFDTFARLGANGSNPAGEIVRIQKELHQALGGKLKEHRGNAEHDFGLDSHGTDDYRILFPLFREVYEADKAAGTASAPKRKYYDTIMEGLQTFFPTLTNAPVPDLSNASQEPPRALVKAGPAPASTPQPGPAPA